MHRSRLTAIGIDCPTALAAPTAQFWATALGGQAQQSTDSPEYTTVGSARGMEIFVQSVDDAPRLHLDIETDDVTAEVERLERAGAVRVAQVPPWWVLRDPAGMLFCVVPPQTDDFPANANTWHDE